MEWKVIKPDVFATIMDFFTSGLPVVSEDGKPNADTGKNYYLSNVENLYEKLKHIQLSFQSRQMMMMKLLLWSI